MTRKSPCLICVAVLMWEYDGDEVLRIELDNKK